MTESCNNTPSPIMLNTQQAAKRLNISPRTLARMVRDKAIPTGKIRGRRVFNQDLLDQWAQKQCAMTSEVA